MEEMIWKSMDDAPYYVQVLCVLLAGYAGWVSDLAVGRFIARVRDKILDEE